MNKTACVLAMTGLLLLTNISEAKTVRATEMAGIDFSQIREEMIVEFREGDELPVNLTVEGDLAETTQVSTSYLTIKKNFWLKAGQAKIQISMDGTDFKDLNETLDGSLTAGAGTDQTGGIANAVTVGLKAFLKK